MYNKMIYVLILGMLYFPSCAQTKWKGGTGDGLWRSPANWAGNVSPVLSPDQDVLLDNSLYPESYTVRITHADSVVVRSLIITPLAGKTITLLIDTSAYRSIALTITSGGIWVNSGGQLINASKATDGNVIKLSDSLRLSNGALYSHQTRRSHTDLATRLSRAPGTENGIFEFNIPSASNTLSLSNQFYGSLHLLSTRFGKSCTYSGGATNPLHIRGDLKIDTGVTLSLNFSDTISIAGNYIQNGGVFNMANSTRSPVIAISGDINVIELRDWDCYNFHHRR